jgi:hypothetical protein
MSYFQESGLFENAYAYARSAYYCRMTGIDVTLDFLEYVRDLVSEESLDYNQAYIAASKTFNWNKYESMIKIT